MNSKILLASLFLVFLAPGLQAGDIFKCIDENNRASFSSTPCPDSAIDGDNEGHRLWRRMRGLVHRGLEINEAIGGNITAMNACKARVEAYRQSLDELRPQVEAVSKDHPDMVSAYLRLQDCAVCRVSSVSACTEANDHLNDAMNNLMFVK